MKMKKLYNMACFQELSFKKLNVLINKQKKKYISIIKGIKSICEQSI